jgi:hypothetical protein
MGASIERRPEWLALWVAPLLAAISTFLFWETIAAILLILVNAPLREIPPEGMVGPGLAIVLPPIFVIAFIIAPFRAVYALQRKHAQCKTQLRSR